MNDALGSRLERAALLLAVVSVATMASVVDTVAQTAGQGGVPFLNTNAIPYYSVDSGAVVRINGNRYHNRPLYANHLRAYVLAGDQPNIRLVQDPYAYGNMQMAVSRSGDPVPIHEFSRRESRYEPNRMTWILQHDLVLGLTLELRAAPSEHGAGMVLELIVTGAQPNDELLWSFGGCVARETDQGPSIAWDLDPLGHPELMERAFVPEDCRDDRVVLTEGGFLLTLPERPNVTKQMVRGRCSAATAMKIADARRWTAPEGSLNEDELPLAAGRLPLADGKLYWLIDVVEENAEAAEIAPEALSQHFQRGWNRCVELGNQVVLRTPDPALDIVASCAAVALDGVYIPPTYNHGGMLWNVPFPGWRTLYGPTAYGWADNVLAQAEHYIRSQETKELGQVASADPKFGYGQEAPDSRFYGKGRIKQDTAFYNFQSQFFDMLVHAWRWTGDERLDTILRPALELHLEWQQECFDPDNDGLYESYINTWPTDCVWFNGGGTPEETAYAYRGHLAAADMARRAGDASAEAFHRDRAIQIRESLMSQLWIMERGHFGAYRDQLGHRRVHTDAWLYSIVCPIDAGMLDPLDALQALHYTEWGLERVKVPFGGERCWTSNWVPSVWSVREMYPGDNYHLALAYYQAGQPEAAWELLRGNMMAYALDGGVPGSLGVPNGGTDFNDTSSMFARVVVEGLFGIRPDYPNDTVTIAPGFPRDWGHASIKTPQFAVAFDRTMDIDHTLDRYEVVLAKPAILNFEALLSAKRIHSVTVNGSAVTPTLRPAVGRTRVAIPIDHAGKADIAITWSGTIDEFAEAILDVNVGGPVHISSPAGEVAAVHDPQSALEALSQKDGGWEAIAAKLPGNHMLLAEVRTGELSQWQRYPLNVRDKAAESAMEAFVLREAPADAAWTQLDLSPHFNADVLAIFQQEYLQPRPKTCSVRIGSDGYSPWCFYYWGRKAPEVTLDLVDSLLTERGLVTKQGVPFRWSGTDRNIAFTSLWENWPASVTIPINAKGTAIWFLVCGSTNPMQTRIANAVIRLTYADQQTETLELVPPLNFWSLCPLGDSDYNYERDGFCLPKAPPMTVQLGENCRANVLGCRLRAGETLQSVTLETLSQDVVVGLMGVSILSQKQ